MTYCSIIRIILIIPPFLILIWGLPTFHFIATFRIFKNTLVAYYFNAYLTCGLLSIYYRRTNVSILISISQSSDIQYSRTVRISLIYLIASPSQFRTIVSNLNLFLLVLFQFTYYFFDIIWAKTGPTYWECSSGTDLYPAFFARVYIEDFTLPLNSGEIVLVA